MTRKTQATTIAIVLTLVYLGLLLDILPTPFVSDEIRAQIVPCLPFNLLITCASLWLGELGWGIITFGECDEAYEELMQEISIARDDLRAKGVSVD